MFVLNQISEYVWHYTILLLLVLWLFIAQTYYIRFMYYRVDCIHDMFHSVVDGLFGDSHMDEEYDEEFADAFRSFLEANGVDLEEHEHGEISNADAIKEWDGGN